jgi:hypothetical protein
MAKLVRRYCSRLDCYSLLGCWCCSGLEFEVLESLLECLLQLIRDGLYHLLWVRDRKLGVLVHQRCFWECCLHSLIWYCPYLLDGLLFSWFGG